MIHPDDVTAWIAQVRQHPEAAPEIIEALAERLIELDRQNEALRDQLVRLSRSKDASGEPRVAVLMRRVRALERQLESGAPGQPETVARSLLVLTLDGRGARMPLPNAESWQRRDDPSLVAKHLRPQHLLVAADEDDLLLFSSKGRAMRVSVNDIEATEAPFNYLSLVPGLSLDLDESVRVAIPLLWDFEQLTLVSRKGYVRSFRRAEVESFLERKLPLHSSPVVGDYPAFAMLGDGKQDIVIATRTGKGVRFPERAVGVQAKPGINLDRGDVVIGAATVSDEVDLAVVSADGTGARRQMSGFSAHPNAGNRGKMFMRIDELATLAPVSDKDMLWLLTADGHLHAAVAARLPLGPGASSGRSILRLDEDRVLAADASPGG
jgi:DNA gyrase/topoisomerase IV subunit A